MPVKPWETPPGQQDRDRQAKPAAAVEPRSSDTPIRAADANEDAQTIDDLSAYGDEPINTHGSER
jgi:hypothetical protein